MASKLNKKDKISDSNTLCALIKNHSLTETQIVKLTHNLAQCEIDLSQDALIEVENFYKIDPTLFPKEELLQLAREKSKQHKKETESITFLHKAVDHIAVMKKKIKQMKKEKISSTDLKRLLLEAYKYAINYPQLVKLQKGVVLNRKIEKLIEKRPSREELVELSQQIGKKNKLIDPQLLENLNFLNEVSEKLLSKGNSLLVESRLNANLLEEIAEVLEQLKVNNISLNIENRLTLKAQEYTWLLKIYHLATLIIGDPAPQKMVTKKKEQDNSRKKKKAKIEFEMEIEAEYPNMASETNNISIQLINIENSSELGVNFTPSKDITTEHMVFHVKLLLESFIIPNLKYLQIFKGLVQESNDFLSPTILNLYTLTKEFVWRNEVQMAEANDIMPISVFKKLIQDVPESIKNENDNAYAKLEEKYLIYQNWENDISNLYFILNEYLMKINGNSANSSDFKGKVEDFANKIYTKKEEYNESNLSKIWESQNLLEKLIQSEKILELITIGGQLIFNLSHKVKIDKFDILIKTKELLDLLKIEDCPLRAKINDFYEANKEILFEIQKFNQQLLGRESIKKDDEWFTSFQLYEECENKVELKRTVLFLSKLKHINWLNLYQEILLLSNDLAKYKEWESAVSNFFKNYSQDYIRVKIKSLSAKDITTITTTLKKLKMDLFNLTVHDSERTFQLMAYEWTLKVEFLFHDVNSIFTPKNSLSEWCALKYYDLKLKGYISADVLKAVSAEIEKTQKLIELTNEIKDFGDLEKKKSKKQSKLMNISTIDDLQKLYQIINENKINLQEQSAHVKSVLDYFLKKISILKEIDHYAKGTKKVITLEQLQNLNDYIKNTAIKFPDQEKQIQGLLNRANEFMTKFNSIDFSKQSQSVISINKEYDSIPIIIPEFQSKISKLQESFSTLHEIQEELTFLEKNTFTGLAIRSEKLAHLEEKLEKLKIKNIDKYKMAALQLRIDILLAMIKTENQEKLPYIPFSSLLLLMERVYRYQLKFLKDEKVLKAVENLENIVRQAEIKVEDIKKQTSVSSLMKINDKIFNSIDLSDEIRDQKTAILASKHQGAMLSPNTSKSFLIELKSKSQKVDTYPEDNKDSDDNLDRSMNLSDLLKSTLLATTTVISADTANTSGKVSKTKIFGKDITNSPQTIKIITLSKPSSINKERVKIDYSKKKLDKREQVTYELTKILMNNPKFELEKSEASVYAAKIEKRYFLKYVEDKYLYEENVRDVLFVLQSLYDCDNLCRNLKRNNFSPDLIAKWAIKSEKELFDLEKKIDLPTSKEKKKLKTGSNKGKQPSTEEKSKKIKTNNNSGNASQSTNNESSMSNLKKKDPSGVVAFHNDSNNRENLLSKRIATPKTEKQSVSQKTVFETDAELLKTINIQNKKSYEYYKIFHGTIRLADNKQLHDIPFVTVDPHNNLKNFPELPRILEFSEHVLLSEFHSYMINIFERIKEKKNDCKVCTCWVDYNNDSMKNKLHELAKELTLQKYVIVSKISPQTKIMIFGRAQMKSDWLSCTPSSCINAPKKETYLYAFLIDKGFNIPARRLIPQKIQYESAHKNSSNKDPRKILSEDETLSKKAMTPKPSGKSFADKPILEPQILNSTSPGLNPYNQKSHNLIVSPAARTFSYGQTTPHYFQNNHHYNHMPNEEYFDYAQQEGNFHYERQGNYYLNPMYNRNKQGNHRLTEHEYKLKQLNNGETRRILPYYEKKRYPNMNSNKWECGFSPDQNSFQEHSEIQDSNREENLQQYENRYEDFQKVNHNRVQNKNFNQMLSKYDFNNQYYNQQDNYGQRFRTKNIREYQNDFYGNENSFDYEPPNFDRNNFNLFAAKNKNKFDPKNVSYSDQFDSYTNYNAYPNSYDLQNRNQKQFSNQTPKVIHPFIAQKVSQINNFMPQNPRISENEQLMILRDGNLIPLNIRAGSVPALNPINNPEKSKKAKKKNKKNNAKVESNLKFNINGQLVTVAQLEKLMASNNSGQKIIDISQLASGMSNSVLHPSTTNSITNLNNSNSNKPNILNFDNNVSQISFGNHTNLTNFYNNTNLGNKTNNADTINSSNKFNKQSQSTNSNIASPNANNLSNPGTENNSNNNNFFNSINIPGNTIDTNVVKYDVGNKTQTNARNTINDMKSITSINNSISFINHPNNATDINKSNNIHKFRVTQQEVIMSSVSSKNNIPVNVLNYDFQSQNINNF